MKQLFEVSAEVDATGKAPACYSQATVFAIVVAGSEAAAGEWMTHDLQEGGYKLVHPGIKVSRIDPSGWPQYVSERWAGLSRQLPSETDLVRMLQNEFLLHLSFFPHD